MSTIACRRARVRSSWPSASLRSVMSSKAPCHRCGQRARRGHQPRLVVDPDDAAVGGEEAIVLPVHIARRDDRASLAASISSRVVRMEDLGPESNLAPPFGLVSEQPTNLGTDVDERSRCGRAFGDHFFVGHQRRVLDQRSVAGFGLRGLLLGALPFDRGPKDPRRGDERVDLGGLPAASVGTVVEPDRSPPVGRRS